MIQITTKEVAVYIAQDAIVHLGGPEVGFLKKQVFKTAQQRVRLCVHKSIDERLQEMLVVASRNSYTQPAKHVGKEESTHIIQGVADLVFFDDGGTITEVFPMGDLTSGRPFYCRVPGSRFHTLLIRSPLLIFHECTLGPFRNSDTIYPAWSPAKDDIREAQKYMARLIQEVDQFYERTNRSRVAP